MSPYGCTEPPFLGPLNKTQKEIARNEKIISNFAVLYKSVMVCVCV